MITKVMVAGASGQVAGALQDEALKIKDISLVAFGRARLDIADKAAVFAAVKEYRPDVIVNAAAYTAVDRAETEEELAERVNADGPANLAAAATEAGISLIHLSTDYVFDGTKTSPYNEKDSTRPLGVYGRTKLAGEDAIRDLCTRHVILRTAWVYHHEGQNFVKTMLRLGTERDLLRVVDDQMGNPTYAASIAQAIMTIIASLRASANDQSLYGTFHLAGQGDVSWCGFARAIFEQQAQKGKKTPQLEAITTADYPTAAQRPANSRLDCSKLASVYNIKLPHWREDLKTCLRRLEANAEIGS